MSLNNPAPAGGAVVTLSSNNPNASVPPSVTVPAGSTVSPAFTITTTAVTATTSVTISASYSGSTVTATLTLTASTGSPTVFLQGTTSEISGTLNGSSVTPAIAPPGFTGTVVNAGGSVNFPGPGDGVYFLNCCNTRNAYYKFTGLPVGTVFGSTQGQISFTLTSRYSFAQRPLNLTRYIFDARDGGGNHLFYFASQATSGSPNYLMFQYAVAGSTATYYVPVGTENTLFGNGVALQVTIAWSSSGSQLYLNGNLVKSAGPGNQTASWNASSLFDLGAYEYLSYGGYNACDDTIADFTITVH